MANKPTAYNNRLGLKGWVYAGNYTFERYLYIGHRLSGLGLISYMVLHIIETANRMRGEEAWAALMGLFASPVFKVVEYLLFAAAVFHAMNGVRLLLVEKFELERVSTALAVAESSRGSSGAIPLDNDS